MLSLHLWHPSRIEVDRLGCPQPWFNALGRVQHAPAGTVLTAQVGEQPPRPLKLGPDGARLAAPGDFNLDLDLASLPVGETHVRFEARTPTGDTATTALTLVRSSETPPPWPLPWRTDFTAPGAPLTDRVQIVDGRWHLGPAGLAVVEPFYDRVVAFGDASWRDYEVIARVRLRAQRVPEPNREVGADVIHVALTLRWPGHHADGHQPHRLWYPLGVTCEFRFLDGPARCRWRMLDPREILADPIRDRTLDWDQPFYLKARVATLDAKTSLYQCKAWPADESEPTAWDLEHCKSPEPIASGGALLVAHFTSVLVEEISARPLP